LDLQLTFAAQLNLLLSQLQVTLGSNCRASSIYLSAISAGGLSRVGTAGLGGDLIEADIKLRDVIVLGGSARRGCWRGVEFVDLLNKLEELALLFGLLSLKVLL